MTTALKSAYAATIKGGLFEQYGTSLAGFEPGSLRQQINFLFNRRSMLPMKEMVLTLLGATAGSAASKTRTRIEASTTEQGGKRTIETETLLDTNSAADDITTITADLLADIQYDNTPTANKNGNPLGSAGLF